MGSVAEEIIRCSPVPVVTVGPGAKKSAHDRGQFHRLLFATDFTRASRTATPFAVWLAKENHARLLILHMMRLSKGPRDDQEQRFERLVAEAIRRLHEIVPNDAKLALPTEVAVEYGKPVQRIVEAAKQRRADLIVLGISAAGWRNGVATHVDSAIAYKVIAHAACPVLTMYDGMRGTASHEA